MAMRHDNAFRASGAYSLVSARKKGLPPSGSTMGKSATRTRSRFFAASCMGSVASLPEFHSGREATEPMQEAAKNLLLVLFAPFPLVDPPRGGPFVLALPRDNA